LKEGENLKGARVRFTQRSKLIEMIKWRFWIKRFFVSALKKAKSNIIAYRMFRSISNPNADTINKNVKEIARREARWLACCLGERESSVGVLDKCVMNVIQREGIAFESTFLEILSALSNLCARILSLFLMAFTAVL